MADETTTTWANLLREARGPLVEALKWKTPLLSEIKKDNNPKRWNGKQITIPIFTAPQQGGGMTSETGAINAPAVVDVSQANITSATIAIAISFTPQVMHQSSTSDQNSWAELVPTKMQRAEDIIGRLMNEQMVGAGNALLASVYDNTGSPGLVVTITTASFNPYQLYAGRIVDVLTRSSGADPGAGLARKIASTDGTVSPPTVTFSTTSFGGGSGSITFANTAGLYIQGSYGNAMAGVGGAVTTTGTFQGINKANVVAWQGVDASPSAASDPSLAIFDGAERKAAQRAGRTPDFYLADPAVVDKFTQLMTVQAQWSGDKGTLESGWEGVKYRSKVIIPDFDMAPGTAYGIARDDAKLYTLMDGPDWDNMTGNMFQRPQTTRTLVVEAWLYWMVQLGFTACNSFVKIGSLNQAS